MVIGGDSGDLEVVNLNPSTRYEMVDFFTFVCCKIILQFTFERQKVNEKEAGAGVLKI